VIPENVPTEVIELADSWTAPRHTNMLYSMHRDEAAEILAHFWPALEAHFARQHALVVLAERDRLWASEYENSGRDESVVPDTLEEAADLLVPGISMERR
jgi:hypothetical protein